MNLHDMLQRQAIWVLSANQLGTFLESLSKFAADQTLLGLLLRQLHSAIWSPGIDRRVALIWSGTFLTAKSDVKVLGTSGVSISQPAGATNQWGRITMRAKIYLSTY